MGTSFRTSGRSFGQEWRSCCRNSYKKELTGNMYPRAWFDTYWRGSLKMEVFIAMSFAEEFNPIWKHAIVPAIQEDLEGGKRYLAHRVDITTLSGSIVTEIFDGVAHAKLVFADISVMPTGPCAGQRNGNVM